MNVTAEVSTYDNENKVTFSMGTMRYVIIEPDHSGDKAMITGKNGTANVWQLWMSFDELERRLRP